MDKDIEHFFMCLFSICTLSFDNDVFTSFDYLFSGLLILFRLGFLSSMYILVMNPLSNVQLAKILSHSVGCLFSLVTVSFAVQKFFCFMQSHLSILSLNC
jgi:hypothetical protein